MTDADDALLRRIRAAAERFDPPAPDLAERVIAAIAVEDLSRDYALLTLVESALGAVRGEAETTTLQFSDGRIGLLLHISRTARDTRRIDGWVDAQVREVRLSQGSRARSVPPDATGRFAFDDVPAGLTRVRLVADGETGDLLTPRFEV